MKKIIYLCLAAFLSFASNINPIPLNVTNKMQLPLFARIFDGGAPHNAWGAVQTINPGQTAVIDYQSPSTGNGGLLIFAAHKPDVDVITKNQITEDDIKKATDLSRAYSLPAIMCIRDYGPSTGTLQRKFPCGVGRTYYATTPNNFVITECGLKITADASHTEYGWNASADDAWR